METNHIFKKVNNGNYSLDSRLRGNDNEVLSALTIHFVRGYESEYKYKRCGNSNAV